VPCEFRGGWNKQEHYRGTGPRFADELDWAARWPYRTWEINWPSYRPGIDEELLGIQDFEVDWIFESCDISKEKK
jgi:hypothetical protein